MSDERETDWEAQARNKCTRHISRFTSITHSFTGQNGSNSVKVAIFGLQSFVSVHNYNTHTGNLGKSLTMRLS